MSNVKCSRCDRHYSGIHLKCPYCGAHRSKKTVRKEQEEMSNSKFLVGGIVLLALIIAVVVLIVMSTGGEEPATEQNPVQQPAEFTQDEGVDSIEGTSNDDVGEDLTGEPVIDDEDEPDVQIQSVRILLSGEEKTDVTVSVGDEYDFDFETDPETTDEIATWSSDDENVAVVLQSGDVTAVGSGTTNINVTVGGQTTSMIIRVND